MVMIGKILPRRNYIYMFNFMIKLSDLLVYFTESLLVSDQWLEVNLRTKFNAIITTQSKSVHAHRN